MLLYVCNKLNITPSKSLYVGDTFHDYQAARGSKMSFILAKYGYFSKGKKIKTNYKIKKFSDIINLLAND
jgi:phosphoglycolate phosphatase